MNTKRFIIASAFAALPFLGLHAEPEQKKPIPLDIRNWAEESLEEISVASSADAIAAQLLESPKPKTLLAQNDTVAPKPATPLTTSETQSIFHPEFAIEFIGDLISDARLVLANPDSKAVAPKAPSEA